MARNPQEFDIAIIEDDPGIAEFLRDLLETEGYRVAIFADGTSLDTVIAAAPRLIFLDLMLPHADGSELCRRLRADPRTRQQSIYMMTAAAATPVAQRLRDCRHDGLLNKPFNIDEILDIAARHAQKRLPPPHPDHVALGEAAR